MLKSYNLLNLKVLFLLNSGYIFLQNLSNLAIFVKLPNKFFFKNEDDTKFKFMFTSFFHYKNFISIFSNSQKQLIHFYYFKLRLRGLGFRIKKISNSLFRFFFNMPNFFYLHVPNNCIVKTKGRKFLIFSKKLSVIGEIRAFLLLLYKIIPYRIRGLLYPRQLIWMKPGKKRFN